MRDDVISFLAFGVLVMRVYTLYHVQLKIHSCTECTDQCGDCTIVHVQVHSTRII